MFSCAGKEGEKASADERGAKESFYKAAESGITEKMFLHIVNKVCISAPKI